MLSIYYLYIDLVFNILPYVRIGFKKITLFSELLLQILPPSKYFCVLYWSHESVIVTIFDKCSMNGWTTDSKISIFFFFADDANTR